MNERLSAESERERLVQAILDALGESRWGHDQMDEEYLANFVVDVVLRVQHSDGDVCGSAVIDPPIPPEHFTHAHDPNGDGAM